MRESEKNEEIHEICRALPQKHPLRRQVMSVLAAPDAPLPDIQPVLRGLIRPSLFLKRERVVASWLIDHAAWSDQQRGKLAETLSQVVETALNAGRLNRVFRRAAWLGLVLFCLGYFVLGMMEVLPLSSQLGAGMWGCLLTLVLSAVGVIVKSCSPVPASFRSDQSELGQLRPLIEALGRLGQPVGIAALAKATVNRSLQALATEALHKVTACLRPDDYGTLPLRAVSELCNALTTADSPTTVPVILQALTIVGDGRALGKVEYLARTDLRPEIRQAATQLLPILLQRDRDSHTSSMLLRASSAPPEIGKTLLRPACEQPSVDPSQLLRMVSSQEENERQ